MIKELTENPNKKFRATNKNHPIDRNTIVSVSDGDIVFKNTNMGAVKLISLSTVFEEVKEAVSFKEAIKSLDEGKTVYCEVDNRKFTYKQPRTYITEIRSEEAGCISIKEILEGKWYIEE
jgi:hypothetical protein